MMPTLLHVAAVLAAIQYAAHALLFLSAKPTHGAEEAALLEQMKAQKWAFRGFRRSYWDFYFGYGVLVILWGVVEVALLWELASLPGTGAARALVATLLLANIAHAILTLRYFFLIPMVFDILVAVALAWALFAG